MRRSRAVKLIILMAFLAAVGPLLAAIFIAQRQGLDAELERVSSYSRVVVNRSDRAVEQMLQAIDGLETLHSELGGDACAPAMLNKMRGLGISMEYMKVAGFVRDGRMYCSTLGVHEEGLDIGSVDVQTSNGTRLRYTPPVIPAGTGQAALDVPYVSLERAGFVAMAHRTQAVDLVVDQEGVLFATFDPTTNEIRTSNAPIDASWVSSTVGTTQAAFVADGYVVGVVRSGQVQFTGAIAAVPVRYLNERIQEFILLLLPISLIAGAGLSASFFYLARQQSSLVTQIRMGLKRDEFFLVYQPVVDISDGRWLGAEALLRWKRRDGEIVMPDSFIAAAEQSGAISQLTRRVIELVERDMSALLVAVPDFFIAINLSARDLQSERTLDLLLNLKRNSGANSGQLVVEITERMLVDPEQAARSIQTIRSRGIHVAIDDFGTGYCSLSYLETMSFDALKIDRLFVEAIDKEAATSPVVLHIIEMAKTLGLKIVAEGVETQAQAQYLLDHGVDFAQGWLYCKPLSAEHLIRQFAISGD
ncbi:MAG: EAL domain-containing protein [Pseudohongiella sp.]|nr:EAL domain-containing protein [Pseudohongiella sp.]MDO9521252.1 EAL domain-containing protein [Pseudohongiella sp.]MDP2127291.1 EAL domain-containing protein [Pseudohongiella sp.]